jgi:hypothetical protein
MEKDILIQNLRTKVGEDNCKVISDKTFDGIAESVLPMFADDSKITDDTWKLPVAALVQFAGQKRFDEKAFTEKYKEDYAKEFATQHEKDVEERIRLATEKALEEYKKAKPEEKEEEKNDGPKDIDTKVSAAVAEAIKGLTGADSELGKSLASINAFVTKQTEREKTEIRNRVKADLKKHLLDLKANNEACIDDALDDIEYGDSPTFDGLKQTAISAYEKRYKRYYADGGKPFGGKSAGGEDRKSLFEEHVKRVEEQVKDSADYAKSIVFAK